MKSITIEYLRFGATEGLLREGDRYILTAGQTRPAVEIMMPFHERDFRKKLKSLRYPDDDEDGSMVDEVLGKLAGDVSRVLDAAILESINLHPAESIQIDIVTSASELWALPFEILYSADEYNLDKRDVIITRRIRQDFDEQEDTDWVAVPRILFVSAAPEWLNAETPPIAEHKAALQEALKPWVSPMEIENYEYILPDYSKHLTVLKNASVEDLKKALSDAEKERPYSHIHFLAHGIPDPEADIYDRQFGLALNSEKREVVTPDQLVELLKPLKGSLNCVTLAVCDGGNQSNPIRPGSLGQALHTSGIPVVIASQLPLTMDGSVHFTEAFYSDLLKGQDVRMSIQNARKTLYKLREDHHDFISLVAYIQLPAQYNEYLERLKLKIQLAQVNVLKKWAEHVIHQSGLNEQSIGLVREQFHTHINSVKEYYNTVIKEGVKEKYTIEEMTGLLGSAYKSLSEVEFHYAQVSDEDDDDLPLSSLEKACEYYESGFNYNYSAHWNGIQYISLKVVITGRLEEPFYWEIVEFMAKKAVENPDEYWAYGTLTELYLVASVALGKSMMQESGKAMLNFIERLSDNDDQEFALNSLRRQLKKYTNWWTLENGYFPGCSADLSRDAKELLMVLNEKDNVKSITG